MLSRLIFFAVFGLNFLLFSSNIEAQPDSTLIGLRALVLQQDFDSAIHQMPEKWPREKWFVPLYLKTAFYSKHYTEMFAAYEKLNSVQKYWQYYYSAAYQTRRGNVDSAFILLQQLVIQRNKPPRSALRTDSIFVTLRGDSRWDSLWSKDYYNEYDLKLETAVHELDVKNYDLALTMLDELIETRSSAHRALFLRARLFFEQGVVRSALDDVSLAIKKYNRDPEYYELSAKISHRSSKSRKAFSDIQKALSLDENNPCFYRMATLIAEAGERFDEGLQYSGLYLHAFPDSAAALYRHAGMVFHNGSCMQSLPIINRAIDKSAYQPEYYYLRAQIYQKCKVYARAESDYGFCMDFWPRNGHLYLNRGICRYNLKKYSDACKDLNRALNLGALEADALLRKWCR